MSTGKFIWMLIWDLIWSIVGSLIIAYFTQWEVFPLVCIYFAFDMIWLLIMVRKEAPHAPSK